MYGNYRKQIRSSNGGFPLFVHLGRKGNSEERCPESSQRFPRLLKRTNKWARSSYVPMPQAEVYHFRNILHSTEHRTTSIYIIIPELSDRNLASQKKTEKGPLASKKESLRIITSKLQAARRQNGVRSGTTNYRSGRTTAILPATKFFK
jgi:hypothetical protein